MNVAYKCKMCGREGVVIPETLDQGKDMDSAFEVFPDLVNKWSKMLTCNRCADYLSDRRDSLRKIRRACELLVASRMIKKGPKLMEMETRIRDGLTALTKRFAAITCHYFNKSNVWDVEFVNMLMDKPKEAMNVASHYTRLIATS